jgi:hypothetical protein
VTAEQWSVWIAAASAANANALPPNRPTLRWGVYAVVLEKAGCRPILYIGSGTNSSFGVGARFQHYDEGGHLPQYVSKALFDGFEITHKGLLCWIPMPIPAAVPSWRLLVCALEASIRAAMAAVVRGQR